MKDGIKLTGQFKISRFNVKTGKIIDTIEKSNLVVDTGLQTVAQLIGGFSSLTFPVVAIGEGTTAPLPTDSALQNETTRETVSVTNPSNGVIDYDHTFTFGSGQSFAITELGIFDQLTVSGSTMLNRLTFTARNVSDVIGLIIDGTITVSTP